MFGFGYGVVCNMWCMCGVCDVLGCDGRCGEVWYAYIMRCVMYTYVGQMR